MEGLSILLYDCDADYIRNLARSLQRFLDPAIQIRTYSDTENLEKEKFSEQFGFAICQNGQTDCIRENLEMVYKYQPVSQIAQLLQQALPQLQKGVQTQQLRVKQKWYGIFALDRQDAAMAFSCSMAGILGEHKKVLVIFLMQCSGIERLLGKEKTCDTDGFFLDLRRADNEALLQVNMPEMLLFPEFELLREPENPEVLCELEQEDLQKLIRYLEASVYDAVIWMAGVALRGMQQLLERSCQVYVAEAADAYSICRQQEIEEYCRKLPGNIWEEKIKCIYLPDCEKSECGEHLLWHWRQSAIGQKAEICIKESEVDGC